MVIVNNEYFRLDPWVIIGELATLIKGLGPPDVELFDVKQTGDLVPVILLEDTFLRGYSPLLDAHSSSTFVSSSVSMVNNIFRSHKITKTKSNLPIRNVPETGSVSTS